MIKNTFASIKRESDGSVIGKENKEDIEVFTGSENRITISRVYSIQFYCEYQMAWYPFDQQTCKVEMLLDGVLDNYADLQSGGIQFSGPKELTQYFVKNFEITKDKVKTKDAVIVSRINFELLSKNRKHFVKEFC